MIVRWQHERDDEVDDDTETVADEIDEYDEIFSRLVPADEQRLDWQDDEIDETDESDENDETDEKHEFEYQTQQNIEVVDVVVIIDDSDENDETDSVDDIDEIDVICATSIEQIDELVDETDEIEFAVDELDEVFILIRRVAWMTRFHKRVLENDETQSIICIEYESEQNAITIQALETDE